MAVLKFKRRADLVEFASRYPGSLAAQFVVAIYDKLEGTAMKNEKMLYRTDVGKWSRDLSGLKEVRDQREVQTLCAAMAKLQRQEVPAALDILSQRIKAILLAKTAKGSWEKAQTIELLSMPEASLATSGEVTLAGLPA